MRTRTLFAVVLLMASLMPHIASADVADDVEGGQAYGTIMGSPLLVYGNIKTFTDDYLVIAYQAGPWDVFSGVRVVAFRVSPYLVGSLDRRKVDDVVVGPEGLAVVSSQPFAVRLKVDLPVSGSWDLTFYAGSDFDEESGCISLWSSIVGEVAMATVAGIAADEQGSNRVNCSLIARYSSGYFLFAPEST